jgi:hypothetical protein
MCPFGLPLKMIIGVKKSPAAVTVSAAVARFVPSVVFLTLTVFTPRFASVFELWYEKKKGVWSMFQT